MMQFERLYDYIMEDLEAGTLKLPTLPETAMTVNEVSTNPLVSSKEIADIIAKDATVSATLIKWANSPLYRRLNKVSTIQQAITQLGISRTRNLVTSIVMQQMFHQTNSLMRDYIRGVWQHSIKVAAASKVISSRVSHIQEDEALLAGLIHAIGVLPIVEKADDISELKNDRELLESLISALYPKVGGRILTQWDFPKGLVTAVAEHTDLKRDSVNGPDLTDVVQVANLQCHLNNNVSIHEDLNDVPAFQKLGIDATVDSVAEYQEIEEYNETLAMF